jgi:hypothetical protein
MNNACNLVATASVLLSVTRLGLVVRGRREKKEIKREPVSDREGKREGREGGVLEV